MHIINQNWRPLPLCWAMGDIAGTPFERRDNKWVWYLEINRSTRDTPIYCHFQWDISVAENPPFQDDSPIKQDHTEDFQLPCLIISYCKRVLLCPRPFWQTVKDYQRVSLSSSLAQAVQQLQHAGVLST